MAQYTPVNLAYATHDPVGGADESLSPIIFLHGVSASKESWIDVPQIIADRTKRKAYSVDSRNHGDTEWSDDFNFDMNVDDLLHFMDTLSIPKAVLVGHSMGGITALRTALRSPQRIEKLFVEDMHVKRFNQEIMDMVVSYSSIFLEAVKSIPVDCPAEDVMRHVMKFVSEKIPEMSQSVSNVEELQKMNFPVKRDANGRYLFKANMDVIIEALKKLDTIMSEPEGLYEGPSYFIYGAVSPFKVYEDEENIRKFFPSAKLIGVEYADHCIHVQFSETFIDLVVKNILY